MTNDQGPLGTLYRCLIENHAPPSMILVVPKSVVFCNNAILILILRFSVYCYDDDDDDDDDYYYY